MAGKRTICPKCRRSIALHQEFCPYCNANVFKNVSVHQMIDKAADSGVTFYTQARRLDLDPVVDREEEERKPGFSDRIPWTGLLVLTVLLALAAAIVEHNREPSGLETVLAVDAEIVTLLSQGNVVDYTYLRGLMDELEQGLARLVEELVADGAEEGRAPPEAFINRLVVYRGMRARFDRRQARFLAVNDLRRYRRRLGITVAAEMTEN